MCVGALLEWDAAALVYAAPNTVSTGLPARCIQLAQHPASARRLDVVAGIRRAEAEELMGSSPGHHRGLTAGHGPIRIALEASIPPPGSLAILRGGEVSEWLMVPLSKSGLRKQRGFESHPLRHSDLADDPASDLVGSAILSGGEVA